MQIRLQNIKPRFLEPEKISGSEVWQQDLCFEAGQHVQVIAPSGTGKTSLVHFIYMNRNDFAGSIFFNEKNVNQLSPGEVAAIRSSQISIVFQDLRLFADKTAYENIRIKKILDPFPQALPIEAMAERLGIHNKLQQRAEICSYGEQQRIAIIRALQQSFDFLILDEPFSHLDVANSQKAMELILEEAGKRQAGILLLGLDEGSIFKADKTFHL